MDAKYFRQCMQLMASVVDVSEPRPALRGVLLEFRPEHINMVGTDGKRIAMVRTEAAHMMGHADIIVRLPAGSEVLEGPVTFLAGMVVDDAGHFVTLETIEAPVMDWRRAVVPQGALSHVAVDSVLLADTVRALAPFGWLSISNARLPGGPAVQLTAKHGAGAVVMGVKP